ncbi:MAG TPA: NBR1-Ig-like domain-containing protein [Anaerolineales bacterium]|nr:NBR1-Ig-like domain-containing protein [Anaerolineales bacterium]
MLVRKTPRQLLFILLTAALTLAACNAGATPAPTVDVNAINTAAFETAAAQIAAQQTQTALAAPSNTPPPTNTALSLSTAALPTAGTPGAASPTAGSGALPTVSFNVTPNTTPLAGFTAVVGSPVAPAATVSLGDACNNNIFVADVTIPDGTIFNDDAGRGGRPGDEFQKVWRVQNTGSCTWDEGYTLAFVGGSSALNPKSVVFDSADDFVAAGATADLGVNLTAPLQPGDYTATWRMQSDNGTFFGTPLTVVIKVVE